MSCQLHSRSPALLQLEARKNILWSPQALLLNSLSAGEQKVEAVALAVGLVVLGGALHGVAMALRKFFGQGHVDYWKQWRCWSGVLCDGVGGLFIWPAMPILATQVLMPLATVVQLVAAYSLALAFFKERVAAVNHMGLVLAVVGVVGISVSSPIHASTPRAASLDRWEQPRFLCVLACCLVLVSGSFVLRMPMRWALATAICEAIQFLTSRTLAGAVLNWGTEEQSTLALLAAAGLKGSCIIGIMHFQQMGMEEELSRFVGTFMVATNLLTVVMCLSFFGDQVVVSTVFCGSALATLVGIWLLNETDTKRSTKSGDFAQTEKR